MTTPPILRTAIPATFLAALLLVACSPENPTVQAATGSGELRVRRGEFRDRVVLTGELEAAEGAVIAVPRLPSWQTSIKWMASEGTEVAEGEAIVELDNSEFATSLEQKRSTLTEAEHQLAQKRSELDASLAEKEYDVEKRKSEFDKAKIDASVPDELLARREVEDRKLALERTQTEFQKAQSTHEAAVRKGETELANLRLSLEKAQREVAVAEGAIHTLTLRAPQRGIIVVNEHPWEGRKLQTGDSVFVGMPLAQIPNLRTLQVVGTLADVDDGKIAAGMPVVMAIDAYPNHAFSGRIREIAPVAQELGRGSLRRGFRVMIPIDEIDLERMRPGLSVRLEVDRGTKADALLAPRSAVNLVASKARLANGRFVDVELGGCNAQDCVVQAGLAENTALMPLWKKEAAR